MFPELIIPFFITREEAQNILRAWCEENSNQPEAAQVLQNLSQLEGFYLPYQLVRGPVSCQVARDNTDRTYQCGGYLDGIAVNTSLQLDNLVLDAIEPFNWDTVREFAFSYLAGQKVKLQDIPERELERRVQAEIVQDYTPVVEKTMQTKGIRLSPTMNEILIMPILLPVYILQCGNNAEKFHVAINGQNGKVAVSAAKQKKDYSYLREPILVSLAIWLLSAGLAFWLTGAVSWKQSFTDYACWPALVLTMITFTVFTNQRKAKIFRPIFQSNRIVSGRQQGRLILEESAQAMKEPGQPVFFEMIRGQILPVHIHFYSATRISLWVFFGLLLSFAPIILGFILAGGNTEQLFFAGAFPWICIAVICIPAAFMRFGRVVFYDHPILDFIGNQGELIRIPPKEYSSFSLPGFIKFLFTSPMTRNVVWGMLVFMLFSSVLYAFGNL